MLKRSIRKTKSNFCLHYILQGHIHDVKTQGTTTHLVHIHVGIHSYKEINISENIRHINIESDPQQNTITKKSTRGDISQR